MTEPAANANPSTVSGKLHYAWIICVVCTMVLFCNLGLTATGFAPYQPFLISTAGLTNTQVSSIGTLRSLFGAICMLVITKAIKRFGIRRLVPVSMFITTMAFVVYGYADSYTGYCIAAILTGCAYGIGGNICVSVLISRWFHTHQGLALGVCMASTGFSAFVASPIITKLIMNYSLSTAFHVEAAFIFVIGLIVTFLIRETPKDMHLLPLGEGGSVKQKINPYASKNPPHHLFIMACISIFIIGATCNNLAYHYSVLYQSNGFSPLQIATLVSIFGLSLAAGKCIYGELCDRLGVFYSTIIVYAIQLSGIILCCLAPLGSMTLACASVLLMGLGSCVGSVTISTYAIAISTEEAYPGVLSRFQLLSMLGTLIFGVMPGMIADATGSYIPAFIILFVLTLYAAVSLQVIYKKIQK